MDLAKLRNLYWFLRWERQKGKKRKWYRRIQAEKTRLLEAGCDYILLHNYTRVLTNPKNQYALRRYELARDNRPLNGFRFEY